MSPLYAGKRPVSERLLGRDQAGDIIVEAELPKALRWRLTVAEEVAGTPLAMVARHHFDESDGGTAEWLIDDKYAPDLVQILSDNDAAGLVALVNKSIRNTEKKEIRND